MLQQVLNSSDTPGSKGFGEQLSLRHLWRHNFFFPIMGATAICNSARVAYLLFSRGSFNMNKVSSTSTVDEQGITIICHHCTTVVSFDIKSSRRCWLYQSALTQFIRCLANHHCDALRLCYLYGIVNLPPTQ